MEGAGPWGPGSFLNAPHPFTASSSTGRTPRHAQSLVNKLVFKARLRESKSRLRHRREWVQNGGGQGNVLKRAQVNNLICSFPPLMLFATFLSRNGQCEGVLYISPNGSGLRFHFSSSLAMLLGFLIIFFCSYFSDRPGLILISRIERKSQSVYKDKKSLNRTGPVARRSSAGRQRNLAFNSLPLVSLQYGLSVTRVASANQTSLNNFTHCNHLVLVVCFVS